MGSSDEQNGQPQCGTRRPALFRLAFVVIVQDSASAVAMGDQRGDNSDRLGLQELALG